ncbi:MAG TPA: hypothetical protein VMU97_00290 [Candidatus Dormibacteraeota bacterium]|nr:hypothetical protein [Candidatus Dormibacteraeota bacterium]
MKQLRVYIGERARLFSWLVLAVAGLSWLLLHKLGTLTGGLSSGELVSAAAPVGWHGIYHQPLYLPLKIIRSIVFVMFPAHGQTLTRLPNAILGGLAVVSFIWLIRLWHGGRTAVLAGLLFATGAWTLHASRLASFDVLYLWAMPTLLLTHVLFYKYGQRALVWYGSLVLWGLLLYVPGLVWLVIAEVYLQRAALRAAWRHFKSWRQRVLYILLGLIWLPLLGIYLRHLDNLLNWLGWPAHIATPLHLLKQFGAVPVHLFVRGPQYPDMWLARAPILDIFTLVACVIGIYFYVTHLKAARSRLLGLMAIVGVVLVGLGGPVGLGLLVPLLYVGAATGITYLLHEWLHVFPNNPLGRGLGIGLVALVVSLSCVYNLRAYFVVWPHNEATRAVFIYHR